jgi:glycerol-3-phosphate acyltransferase PlsY
MLESYLSIESLAVFFGSYLIGCMTAGYYLVRLRAGVDIREIGSGSIGARNVGRILGWTGFLVTMVTDVTKGALAVWLADYFTNRETMAGLAMVSVVAGHVWPVQLGFRGGKGVASCIGALAIFDLQLAVIFAVFFAAGLILARSTLLSGLLAFSLLPLSSLLLEHPAPKIFAVAVAAGIIVVAHRRNLADAITEMLPDREIHSDESSDETTI